MNGKWCVMAAAAVSAASNAGTRPAGILLVAVGVVLIAAGVVFRCSVKTKVAHQENKTENVKISAESIVGDRKYQQDFFLFTTDGAAPAAMESGVIAIVCDGMGGMEGGEIASRMCAELIYNGFYQLGQIDDVCQILKELVSAADAEVSAITSQDGRKLKSGTTIVAVVVRGNKAYWVSVGDSRIYFMHNGRLERLTRDHNFRLLLQEQCNAGLISQEEVDTDQQKEALISYVGKGGNLIVDVGEVEFGVADDDILLLCSDGLYKSIEDDEISRLTHEYMADTSRLPGALVRAAMSGGRPGKHDNITVLALSRLRHRDVQYIR